MNTKVLLVDDHPMLCSGLRQELAQKTGLEIVGQASNAVEASRLARELAPALVIMDVYLPDGDGIAVARDILNVLRSVKIIIFSTESSQLRVDEALRAGACGYVLKSSAVDELMRAIELVMQGRMYVSPELSTGILEGYRESLIHGRASDGQALTEKEKQLLRLLADGERSKEIAVHLNLSLSSVETYRTRLRKKLDCQSTADLVRYAIVNKIVEI